MDGEISLKGAKWVTYLMFLGKERNTSEVVEVLVKNKIVKNKDVVYLYINDLEKMGFIETVKVLPEPGPPKIRRVKDLSPIFSVASYFRIWKIKYGRDERQFTDEEKQKFESLFERISPFLDYFPEYFSWAAKVLRKSIRNIEFYETLGIFFEFCQQLIEICWFIKSDLANDEEILKKFLKREITIKEDKNPLVVATLHLTHDPYRYIYDSLFIKKKASFSDIEALGAFSTYGHKDIYIKGSFLQNLYLNRIALRNPLGADAFYQELETIETMLWRDKIREVNVRPLYLAIWDKAREEEREIREKIEQEIKKLRRTSEKWSFQEEVKIIREADSYKEEEVKRILRDIIKTTDLNITEDELERALLELEVYQRLKDYFESRYYNILLKLKESKKK